MAAKPSQLLLLADHIKLSLLERQRAVSLKLEPNAQNSEISRSLNSLREGVEALEVQELYVFIKGLSFNQADSKCSSPELSQQAATLRSQYNDLNSQFTGSSPITSLSITKPNANSLSSDFSRAQSTPTKSVRFSEHAATDDHDPNRAALLPYQDEPDDSAPDHAHLDNQQIHQYHSQVIQEQDQQLDQLGVSISRQRELSIQIGDELDEQAEILDDVDQGIDRHQTQLDRARHRLGKFARKAKDNMSMTAIIVLIVILVLLIVILK